MTTTVNPLRTAAQLMMWFADNTDRLDLRKKSPLECALWFAAWEDAERFAGMTQEDFAAEVTRGIALGPFESARDLQRWLNRTWADADAYNEQGERHAWLETALLKMFQK